MQYRKFTLNIPGVKWTNCSTRYNTQEIRIKTRKKSLFLINVADTTYGDSGSCLYCCDFRIFWKTPTTVTRGNSVGAIPWCDSVIFTELPRYRDKCYREGLFREKGIAPWGFSVIFDIQVHLYLFYEKVI